MPALSDQSTAEIRKDFPVLHKTMRGKQLVYFDSGATAQKPVQVIDAMDCFYREHYGTVHRAVYELAEYSTQAYSGVREKVRAFLNASKVEEIIFTRGTTESINLVAHSFGKAFVKPGDEIIISTLEHHSNIVPWQMLCEVRGAFLKVIPVDDIGVLDLEAYQRLLTPKTRLVAIAHVANSIGTLNPVKEMAAMAHQAGAYLLVDGAQAAPHLPLDVRSLGVDFYVFSGHKLYGPTGIGVLFGREELLQQMPPYQGGGDMISHVTFEKTTYNALPLKFEAGTPMIAEAIGLGAAVDYIESIGLEAICAHENDLLQYATLRLAEVPKLRLIGTAPHKGAIISFVVEGAHHLDVGTFLDLKGIAARTGHQCAQPTMQRYRVAGTVRVSFGLYNSRSEVDLFIAAMQDIVKKLS